MTKSKHNLSRPGLLTQAATLSIESLNHDNRTAEAIFTTGDLINHRVLHNGVYKVMPTRILVEENAIDLDFLIRQGPLLENHFSFSSEFIIGSIEDAWVKNGEGRARIRFADTPDVEQIWQKICQGHIRNISAGFEVLKQEVRSETAEDGTEFDVMYFTNIKVFELSIVPVPADQGAYIQSSGVPVTSVLPKAGAIPHLSCQGKENNMAENIPESVKEDVQTPSTPPPAPAPPELANNLRQQIRQEESTRFAEMQKIGTSLGTAQETIQQAFESGITLDEFRAQEVDAFASRAQQLTQGLAGPRANVTMDARDRFRQGAFEGQMARMGLGGERNEFSGLRLSELARQSLNVLGVTVPFDPREMIGAAFTQSGAHSTSDFANILSSIASKAVLRGWEESEETFEMWTRSGTLPDYKQTQRVGLGSVDSLPKIIEGAEYTFGSVSDRAETIAIAKYGRALNITREAIINDDLNLFSMLPVKMGRAARRTVGDLCYAVLTANAKMSDGVALFHGNHRNLAGSGGVPSIDTLSAARSAMRTQKDPDKKHALNIVPAYLIVPAALETLARQYMDSPVDPTAEKGHAINPVAGMATVIADGRLDDHSATSWYLAADPQRFDTVEVAYLNGNEQPFIEETTSWSTDGVKIKVRIEAGVAPLDFRTFYKNPGV